MLRRLPRLAGRARSSPAWRRLLAIVIALPAAALVIATPGARLRAAVTRLLCRGLIALTGTPLSISGPTAAARGGRVVVANHASYVDALIVRAALPGRLFFVAKRELADSRALRLLLERVGCEFVERSNHARGLSDLERIRERAAAGETVVAFPEGTFAHGAGLRGFRVGAFMVAVQAGIEVVPVAIRGSRRLLRGSSLWPRPSRLALVAGEPIAPAGNDWNAALSLRDAARAHILAHCDEPDLAPGGGGVAGNL
ncbi:MAG: lysophospholipid acyltransferase family protein [Halofilum sp. (in: g-proteobacteria)]|nr:lysophospholipid acyltransferase family protein [Halofilum sp. (in: g-proteobacteria)]